MISPENNEVKCDSIQNVVNLYIGKNIYEKHRETPDKFRLYVRNSKIVSKQRPSYSKRTHSENILLSVFISVVYKTENTSKFDHVAY